jgi:uncharacterized protein (DUF2147 family)
LHISNRAGPRVRSSCRWCNHDRLKKDGDEYAGGQILDPDDGKVYSSKVHLTDGGRKLNVRGYIGVPMLGRTQTWVRQE